MYDEASSISGFPTSFVTKLCFVGLAAEPRLRLLGRTSFLSGAKSLDSESEMVKTESEGFPFAMTDTTSICLIQDNQKGRSRDASRTGSIPLDHS